MNSTSHANSKKEAKLLYTSFRPFPEWKMFLEEKGHLILSGCSVLLMAGAALNEVLIKQAGVTNFLWAAFLAWAVVFFAYAIFKVVYGRRRAKLFQYYYPYAANILRIRS